MLYNSHKRCYFFRIEVLEPCLLCLDDDAFSKMDEIREKEAKKFEKEFRVMKQSVEHCHHACWSEMFYDIYDQVEPYCPGCNEHTSADDGRSNRFPLLAPITQPHQLMAPDCMNLLENCDEMLICEPNDRIPIIQALLNKGVTTLIVDDTWHRLHDTCLSSLPLHPTLQLMDIGEFCSLQKIKSTYYTAGVVLILYDQNEAKNQENFSLLQRYGKTNECRMIHLMMKELYLTQYEKKVSQFIDGPCWDGALFMRKEGFHV